MRLFTKKNDIVFHSILVHNYLGEPIFLTGPKRANWFLQKGLAEQIDDNNIRLLFKGNKLCPLDEYSTSIKENKCWVCGTIKDLSLHHIIPVCYRRYIENLENYWKVGRDICALCRICHDTYERAAYALKVQIGKEYNVPVEGVRIFSYAKNKGLAIKKAKTLRKYGNTMPDNTKREICDFINTHFPNISWQEVAKLNNKPKIICHGKIVMEKCQDIKAFLLRWQEHFLETMKPQFLPEKFLEF